MSYVFYHIWIDQPRQAEFMDWVKSHYGANSDKLVIDYSYEGEEED
jgi:hypothetical protein